MGVYGFFRSRISITKRGAGKQHIHGEKLIKYGSIEDRDTQVTEFSAVRGYDPRVEHAM